MDRSSSSYGNHRNGKRASESLVDKVRERKRGVGIAKLEEMRAEEEMMKQMNCLKDPFSRAHISEPGIGFQGMVRERKRGVGIAKLEEMRAEEEQMNYLKDPFSRAHIAGPGIGFQGMASYGTSGNVSELYIPPFDRPPSTSGAASGVNPRNTEPSRMLQLYPDHKGDHKHELADSKREDEKSLAVEPTCKTPSDQEDLDLDLKL